MSKVRFRKQLSPVDWKVGSLVTEDPADIWEMSFPNREFRVKIKIFRLRNPDLRNLRRSEFLKLQTNQKEPDSISTL